jgi:predicted porin
MRRGFARHAGLAAFLLAPVLAMGQVAATGPVIGYGRSGTGFFGRGGYVNGAALPGNPMGFQREPTVEVYTEGADGLPVAKVWRTPLHITVGVNAGYDSNPCAGAGGSGGGNTNEPASAFIGASILATYQFVGPRFYGGLSTNAVFNLYSNREDRGDLYQPNANLSASLGYAVSQRLNLDSSATVSYQIEPDISLNATVNRQSGGYLVASGSLGASYAWLPRLSSTATYTLSVTDYAEETENSLSQTVNGLNLGFSVSLLPRTTLIGSYDFNWTAYKSDGTSLSNSLLVGATHQFSLFLNGSLQVGMQFQSTDRDSVGQTSNASPIFESSLAYVLGSKTVLSWNAGYSIESPDVVNASSRETLRTGLNLSHQLTGLISATASAYYRHDMNVMSGDSGNSTENAFDVALGLSYAFRHNMSATISYQRTQLFSTEPGESYSSNRVSLGLLVSF